MFNSIIVVFLVVLGIIGINIPIFEVNVAGWILLATSAIWLFSSFITTFINYTDQLHRFEYFRSAIKKIEIQVEMKEQLLRDFKMYLGDKFPELEKQYFNNITSKLDNTIILKFPELQSSDTMMELVNHINNITHGVTSMYRDLEDSAAQIRYYKTGKWEYFTPSIPSDISKKIFDN